MQDVLLGGNIKSPASSHRLPTVSATQALRDIYTSSPNKILTDLSSLDNVISKGARVSTNEQNCATPGQIQGLQRGSVTEIWGPPGSGKSALALQIAGKCASSSTDVIWIDTCTIISSPRVHRTFGHYGLSHSKHFHHIHAPTLAHLFSLLINPPTFLPWSTTCLVVVENIHVPLEIAAPRQVVKQPSKTSSRPGAATNINRRFTLQAQLITQLKRIASLYNLAVVVTSGVVSRSRQFNYQNQSSQSKHGNKPVHSAVLVSALGGAEWESGVTTRLVCFRDFAHRHGIVEEKEIDGDRQDLGAARFIGVVKAGGRRIVDGDGDVGVTVAVTINDYGIREVMAKSSSAEYIHDDTSNKIEQIGQQEAVVNRIVVSPIKPRPKRKFDEVVADSEDEDDLSEYGWHEGDEVMTELTTDQGLGDVVVTDSIACDTTLSTDDTDSDNGGDGDDNDNDDDDDVVEISRPTTL